MNRCGKNGPRTRIEYRFVIGFKIRRANHPCRFESGLRHQHLCGFALFFVIQFRRQFPQKFQHRFRFSGFSALETKRLPAVRGAFRPRGTYFVGVLLASSSFL